MSRDMITVVTVSFNEGDNLLKTMESVVSQTYRPLEYIVIDGGSTDGSYKRAMEIIAEKAADKGIVLKGVSEPDGGIYFGMNKGASMATGKWVNFMNAGDTFYDNEVISRMFGHDSVPEGAILYGDFLRVKDYAVISSYGESPDVIGNRMPTSHQAMFMLTSLMKKYPYDTSYRVVADFDFVHKMHEMGEAIHYIPGFIARCEAVQGLSSRHRVLMHKECDRVCGVPLTARRRIKYSLKSFEACLMKGLNSLIPAKLLKSIKKINRRRLDKRNKSND